MNQVVTIGLTLALAGSMLSGCGSYPLPKVYVLGGSAPEAPTVSSEAGLPVFELKTVSVPNYLDTADILRNASHDQVIASPTGRWAERVSLGITQALLTALSQRLPNVVVETRSTYEPDWLILVDIQRFEISEDGVCTLAARWRLTAAKGAAAPWADQGVFVERTKAPTDEAAVSALSLDTDHLADQIALTVEHGPDISH